MLDIFIGKHSAHVGTARRVTNRARATAYKADGAMACPLHMCHSHQGDEMPCMEAVRRGVKANIKSHALLIKKFPQFSFIRALRDKATFL
jgi:hypothetical protein